MKPASIFIAAAVFLAGSASAAPNLKTAVFAGGCFWTMEHGLETIPGVVNAVSGYEGGMQPNPTYQQVSTERTGYLESVRVTFDPAKISYAQLVNRYWRLTDPTDGGGQACDRGSSYRPAISVASPQQRQVAEQSKAALAAGPLRGKPIATAIRNAMPFWPAEAYHQHYAERHPVAYGAYRLGCGRDRVLKALWGDR